MVLIDNLDTLGKSNVLLSVSDDLGRMRSEKEVDFGTHVHTLCPFPTEVLTVYHPN